MQELKFHHVCIIASDYEKAVEFYVDFLGLRVHKESFSKNRNAKKLTLYSADNYIVELFIPVEHKNLQPSGTIEHISLLVKNVRQMLSRLESFKVPTSDIKIDVDTGKEYGFCHDPDGTKIEFYQA